MINKMTKNTDEQHKSVAFPDYLHVYLLEFCGVQRKRHVDQPQRNVHSLKRRMHLLVSYLEFI